MSERMTDKRWVELFLLRRALTRNEQGDVMDEAHRARLVEVSQVETIKALVEALRHVRTTSVNERVVNEATGKVDDMKKIVDAALRRAGALK